MDQSSVAATRQKSCDACVRGKRKCDKKLPRCARCTARGIDCHYKKTPPPSVASYTPPSPASLSNSAAVSAPSFAAASAPVTAYCQTSNSPPRATPASSTEDDVFASLVSGPLSASVSEASDFDMTGFDVDDLGTSSHHSGFSATATTPSTVDLQLDPSLTVPDLDFLSGPDSLWNMPSFAAAMAAAENKNELPLIPALHPSTNLPTNPQPGRKQLRDVALLGECVTHVDPVEIYDPRTRIGFITARLKEVYVQFAQTRQVPFLHPRVWSLSTSALTCTTVSSNTYPAPTQWRSAVPQTILVSFSAASAYVNRNPQTMPWTMRLIHDAARDIHREGAKPNLSPRDKLARVVALLILDTIRVFDGDVSARAGVEREADIFLVWLKELNDIRDDMEKTMPFGAQVRRELPPTSWEDWVFLESIRRTVMLSYCFICLFKGLKSEQIPCQDDIGNVYFTASRHLWEAPTAPQFYRAWREKPHYNITNMSFEEFWMYARPDDMDDFTRMFLTAQASPDMLDYFMQSDTTTAPAEEYA